MRKGAKNILPEAGRWHWREEVRQQLSAPQKYHMSRPAVCRVSVRARAPSVFCPWFVRGESVIRPSCLRSSSVGCPLAARGLSVAQLDTSSPKPNCLRFISRPIAPSEGSFPTLHYPLSQLRTPFSNTDAELVVLRNRKRLVPCHYYRLSSRFVSLGVGLYPPVRRKPPLPSGLPQKLILYITE